MNVYKISILALLFQALFCSRVNTIRFTPEKTFFKCVQALKGIRSELGYFEDFDVIGCFSNNDEGTRYRVTLRHEDKPIKRCLMTVWKKTEDDGFVIEKFKNGNLDCHKVLEDEEITDDM